MASFKEDQKKVADARLKVAKAEQVFQSNKVKVQKETNAQSLAAIKAQIKNSGQQYLNAKNGLDAIMNDFHLKHNFKKAASELDAKIPILFLPIRIETRIMTKRNSASLWLRVYPDDIHVDTHDPMLTIQEEKYGVYYWKSLAIANKETGDLKENKKKSAWEDMIKRSGVQRALWIAKETMPSNWKKNFKADIALLEFPKLETKQHDWSRAPKTQALPDRFSVNIYKNNKVVQTTIGAAIPDTVFLGPDPFLAEEAIKKEGKQIKMDESFAWLSDFDEAIRKGLGFKIPLSQSHFSRGKIEKIVVMGLMSSANPKEGKEILEKLIEHHHYSKKGFSFLAQQSPTNNTSDSDSAYTKNEDYLSKGYFDGSDLLEETNEHSDAQNFEKLLGIESGVLKDINHSNLKESFLAAQMNKAIYPSTIGNFIEVLCSPAIPENQFKKVRDFFCDYVHAAGPLPSIRIGDQPYGTLVTSNLNNWDGKDKFHIGLSSILKTLQLKWDAITRSKVAHVGKSGDPSELMLNILGLNAGSQRFNHRLGNLMDFWFPLPDFISHHAGFISKSNLINSFLKSLGYTKQSEFPTISHLTFYDKLNTIPHFKLIDGKIPSDNPLDKLKNSDKNYIEWLAGATSLSLILKPNSQKSPTHVLYLLLRHAILEELKKGAEQIYAKAKVTYKRTTFDKSYYNFDRKTNDITEFEILKGIPKKVDATKLNIGVPIADHILNIRGNSNSNLHLKEMRTAMLELANQSTKTLNKLLSDHLDVISYRLDAWETGLFHKRLAEQRKEQKEGVYIGAYGWVENLKMEAKELVQVDKELLPEVGAKIFKVKENAGFVHSPSLNHATAAGVLMAGYHNHATKSNPSPFSVNLSSARVRRALYVLQGIQQGQSIEALLGYQFERALHDITTSTSNNLNQYTLDIREKFPIEAQSIPQQGTQAQETISPFSVVNGLNLSKAKSNQLTSLVPNATHRQLILKEIDTLKDTLDALNDLLVAESAFQATQGKTDRTAALLNAMKYAEMPPELEINKTPRSSHLNMTNRISLHFNRGGNIKPGKGWVKKNSPRSLAEPGLNEWLESMIGDPRNIVCEVCQLDDELEINSRSITLARLKLNAIDIVFMAGEDMQSAAKELEFHIEHAYRKLETVLDNTILKIKFSPENLTKNNRPLISVLPLLRNLRLCLGTARAASAKDFQPQTKSVNQQPDLAFQWDAAELETRVTKANNSLQSLLNTVLGKVPNGRQPKDENNPANFRALIEAYHNNGSSLAYLKKIELTKGSSKALIRFLRQIYLYGVKVNYPFGIDVKNKNQETELLVQFLSAVATVQKKTSNATKLLIDAQSSEKINVKVNRLKEAGKAVLGDDFTIIPLFKYSNGNDIKSSLTQNAHNDLLRFARVQEGTNDELVMESWLASMGTVRKNIKFFNDARIISEAQGNNEIEFMPCQLPFKELDPWYAVEFPAIDERTGEAYDIKDDTICIGMSGDAARRTNALQSAIVIDDWTEFVPNSKEISGIAFNYNQPNASAPNTMLLAVEPTGAKNWNWDEIMGVIDNTLIRAKSRAVEPAHLLEDPVLDTLSPMTVASFDLNQSNVSLDFLVANKQFLQQAQVKNFTFYKDFELG